MDVDPTVPYLSHRKALMDKRNLPLEDPLLKKALANLAGLRIGTMVIHGLMDDAFIKERVGYFHLNPHFIKICDYYIYHL